MACLPEYEVGDEDEAQDDQSHVELLPLSGAELEDDVAQDTEADAVSNGVAEHHRDHCDERGESLTDIGEVEEFHRVEHQYANEHQCATCCSTGNEQEDRGEEEREDEEHARREGGQSASSALSDTRSTLNISSQRRRTKESATSRADRITHHGFLDVRNGTVRTYDVGLISQADKGSHGIEDIDEQQGYDDHHGAHVEQAVEVELAEDRGEALG